MKNFIATICAIGLLSIIAVPATYADMHDKDSSDAKAMQDELININTATAEELEKLPGIGKVRAQNIIDDRDANGAFSSIEDISRVSGIGDFTLNKIRSLIEVQ